MVGRKGVTKLGFGRLLKAGIPATVIRQWGKDIAIKLDGGEIYHGKVMDFIIDEKEGVENDTH